MQKSFEVTGPTELEIRLASGDITVDAGPTAGSRSN